MSFDMHAFQKAGPSLTIWLARDIAGGSLSNWRTERIVALTREHQSNVVYSAHRLASDTLARPLWTALQPLLPVDKGQFSKALPELQIEIAGLYLKGMKMTGLVGRGVQRIMISFQSVTGCIQAVFAANEVPDMMRDLECTLSSRTLGDILLPAMNLAVAEPLEAYEGAELKVKACLKKLNENKQDIEFYMALIERFVASQTGQAYPVLDGHLSTQKRSPRFAKPRTLLSDLAHSEDAPAG